MLAETWRLYLAWENQVLLPLAREWLSAVDLAELGRAMAARRGAAHPGSTDARSKDADKETHEGVCGQRKQLG